MAGCAGRKNKKQNGRKKRVGLRKKEEG